MKRTLCLLFVLLLHFPPALADPPRRQAAALRGPQRSAECYQQKADAQKRQLARRVVRAIQHPTAANETTVRVAQFQIAALEQQTKAARVAAVEPAKSQALWVKASQLRDAAQALTSSVAAGAEPLRHRLATFARANNRSAVSEAVSEKVRNRPVVQVKTLTDAVDRYVAEVGRNDTIEVIYSPTESSPGHVYLRAGDQLYDFGGPRSADHQPAVRGLRNGFGERYGFVFKGEPQEITELQEIFAQKVQRARSGELRFAMRGDGGENCTLFINSEIARVIPRLGFRADAIDAISTSRWIKKNPYLEAVVVYSSGENCPTAGEAFAFKKLEDVQGE